MIPRICTAVVVAMFAMSLVAGAAHAQKSAKDRASEHIEAGLKHQRLAQYDQAIAEYKAAYDLIPHPMVLYNLATAYRLKGDKETAVHYYEKYIAIETMGSAVDKARAYLTLLKDSLADESHDATPTDTTPAPAEPIAPPTEVAEKPEDDSDRTDSLTTAPVRDTQSSSSPGRTLKIAGISSAVVGLAALSFGIKSGLDASSLKSDLENRDQWTDAELAALPGQLDDVDSKERNMFLLTTIGTAAIAGGVVLYYLGHKKANSAERDDRLSFVPAVGADGVQITLGLHF